MISLYDVSPHPKQKAEVCRAGILAKSIITEGNSELSTCLSTHLFSKVYYGSWTIRRHERCFSTAVIWACHKKSTGATYTVYNG